MPVKPLFPDDPKTSAALPHNFVNPDGEEIGPADYFLNYSGLTGKNLEAALSSVGLEAIKDVNGNIMGATSQPTSNPQIVYGSSVITLTPDYKFTGFVHAKDGPKANGDAKPEPPPRKEPEILSFDQKRKIELEKE